MKKYFLTFLDMKTKNKIIISSIFSLCLVFFVVFFYERLSSRNVENSYVSIDDIFIKNWEKPRKDVIDDSDKYKNNTEIINSIENRDLIGIRMASNNNIESISNLLKGKEPKIKKLLENITLEDIELIKEKIKREGHENSRTWNYFLKIAEFEYEKKWSN